MNLVSGMKNYFTIYKKFYEMKNVSLSSFPLWLAIDMTARGRISLTHSHSEQPKQA